MHLTMVGNFTFQFIITSLIMSGSHNIAEILTKLMTNTNNPEFAKLHMGLVVLVKKMSVLINFLLQNTNLVSVPSKICPNFAGHVWQDWHISQTLITKSYL